MKARIQSEGFDSLESSKLKPFLDIADYFGRKWGRQVVLNVPHGQVQSFETNDEATIVYVHFFSFPPAPTVLTQTKNHAPQLFFLSLPKKVKASDAAANEEDMSLLLNTKFMGKTGSNFVRSPEGFPVAQIVKNHIYILFDLSHKPWEGAEPVFWEILERAAAFMEIGGDSIVSLASVLGAQEKMRAKIFGDKNKILYRFGAVARLLLEEQERKLYKDWEGEWKKLIDLEKELAGLSTRLQMLNDLMANPETEEKFSREYLKKEFESIHSFKNFWRMEVRDNNELHIFTRPIEHVSSSGERRLLSQYKIVIRPGPTSGRNGNKFSAITMQEYGWIGPYYHPEESMKATVNRTAAMPCFGIQYAESIEKLLMDHEYLFLIEGLLHYLDSDNRIPASRFEGARSREIYTPQPAYISEYQRNQTFEAYMNFVLLFRKNMRRQALQNQVSQLESDTKQKRELLYDARRQCELLSVAAQFIRHYAEELPVIEELDEILNIPALINIRVGPDFIWLVFGPGKGKGPYCDVLFPGSFRVLLKPLEGKLSVWGRLNPATHPEDGFLKEYLTSAGNFKHAIFTFKGYEDYFVRGLVGKALGLLYDVLRGQNIENLKLLGTEITEEMIKKYIKDKVFQNPSPPPSQDEGLRQLQRDYAEYATMGLFPM